MRPPEIRFKDRQTECWTYPRVSTYEDTLNDPSAYFDFLRTPAVPAEPLRIYLHIPYCKQFCSFCPYYKKAYGASGTEEKLRLFEGIARELELYGQQPHVAASKLGTIYFGGGDPGVISIEEHSVIWKALRANFDWAPDIDITVEGTALSFLDEEKVSFFRAQGVTRLSFGIQTFAENIRPQLNLEPTLQEIQSAVDNIRRAGIPDMSADMMYNLPGQTDELLEKDLEQVTAIDPKYIDFYALNLYPNTTYMRRVQSGSYGSKPSNETDVRMFRQIQQYLAGRSYRQVSSVTFSKHAQRPHRGFAQTLQGHPMIGIGPSSRSYIAGRNYRNFASNEQYLSALETGRLPVEAGHTATAEELENWPFVFFPIRLSMDWREVERSPRNLLIIEGLISGGYARRTESTVELTEEGRVWAGNIQRLFFSSAERDKERRSLWNAMKSGRNPYNQDFMGVSQSRLRSSGRT